MGTLGWLLPFLLSITLGAGAEGGTGKTTLEDKKSTVVIWLVILLLLLLVALVLLYRKLKRDSGGEFSIHRLVYGEGGVRERLARGLAQARHIVRRMREANPNELDDEEEQGDIEEDVEAGLNQHEKHEEEEEEEAEEEEKGGAESSDDYSSMEGCDLRERAVILKDEDEEKQEEGGASVGLLVDVQQLSGSAVWQGEKSQDEKGKENDLTVL